MFKKGDWIEILRRKLPGEEAHLKMSPSFRGDINEQKDPVEAAVLALFYASERNTHLVFIKRNEYDGPHSAQVSFPGGAREPVDKTREETALRETREEVGIKGRVEILGALTPLHIPISNFMVYPYVGWMEEAPLFRPDPTEVQYVIEAPLSALLDPGNSRSETLKHHGQFMEVPFYSVSNEKIWGATAMMLSEVLQLAALLQ